MSSARSCKYPALALGCRVNSYYFKGKLTVILELLLKLMLMAMRMIMRIVVLLLMCAEHESMSMLMFIWCDTKKVDKHKKYNISFPCQVEATPAKLLRISKFNKHVRVHAHVLGTAHAHANTEWLC